MIPIHDKYVIYNTFIFIKTQLITFAESIGD